MNDDQKTKEQLLEELARERARSLALAEVSKRVAGAHDADEILDLIANEATRLIDAHVAAIRLLQGNLLVHGAATPSLAEYVSEIEEERYDVIPSGGRTAIGRILDSKQPRAVQAGIAS
jgi:GAF domain-containing protein